MKKFRPSLTEIFIYISLFYLTVNSHYTYREVLALKELHSNSVQDTTSKDSVFMLSKENFIEYCKDLGIKHPEIVYSQAVLESGWFESNLYKKHNNCLGLYNSKKKEYYSFESWMHCLEAYRDTVQYKYKGGDYFMFLKNIGYAEDEQYIDKLKKIHKQEFSS